MRIKIFTLMLMAVLFSSVGFAQKSIPVEKRFALNREAKAQLVKQNGILPALAVNPQNNTGRRAAAKAPAKAPQVVTPPADGEVEYFTLEGTNSKGGNITRPVQVVWDGDDDVYISGLSYYLPSAYVKGTFKGDDVIFEMGQYMGSLDGQDIYFGAMDKEDFIDAVATFDEDENAFIFSTSVVDNGDARRLDVLAYWEKGLIIAPMGDDVEMLVEIPSDMEIETYAYTAVDYFSNQATVSGNLNVGFYGNDMYIQGMSTHFPEAWIKGTFVNDTTIVFHTPQLVYDGQQKVYFASSDLSTYVDEYVLYYDTEYGAFYEGEYYPMVTADLSSFSLYQFYYGYLISPISEQAATPAESFVSAMAYMPDGDFLEFSLAKVDEDGFGLVPEKLSYKLWYATEEGDTLVATFTKDEYASLTEDLTEIPATFVDGSDFQEGKLKLNFAEYSSWKGIGIQGIYYGGEERHESKVAWYTPTWPQTITLPEGLTVTDHNLKGKTSKGASVERIVGMAIDGNNMYIRGLCSMDADAWVKGTKNADGNFVFPKGQEIGSYYDEDRLFLLGYTDDDGVTDVVLSIDAANNVYEFATDFVENADYTDKTYYVQWIDAGATISIAEAEPEVLVPVEIPEGLATEVYSFTATDYFDTQSAGSPVTVAKNVLVGFDGDDVYIQGISDALPQAWMKGTLDGDVLTIPAGQYVGNNGSYDIWTIGFINGTGVSDYTMEYDVETSTLTNKSADEFFGTTTVKGSSMNLSDFFYAITIKKLTEKAATPATPSVDHMAFSAYGDFIEFNLPAIDVDGDGLVTSKFSYKFYYDEGDGEAKEVTFVADPEIYKYLTEDMTVIPYGFLDSEDDNGNPAGYDFYANHVYLNMEHDAWTRVGIQSIYTGGDETNVSEIGWYTIPWPQTIELPEGAEVAVYNFAGTDNRGEFSKTVNVAKVGNDIYVQGVGTRDTETWIKGTKNEETGVYTFPKGQYVGLYVNDDQTDFSNLYMIGYSSTFGAVDVKMTYDEETDTYTTTTELVENADYVDKLYYLTRINAGAVIQPVPDVAATPATPSADHMRYTVYGDVLQFTIPVEDVDGAPILPGKLSYKLYYDEGDGEAKEVTFTTDLYDEIEADMTEVAYGFSDDFDFYADHLYLNMDYSSWTRVGIQTIYAGGGETHASEIGWYSIIAPWSPELPEGAEVANYGFIGTSFDGTSQSEFMTGGLSLAKVDDDVYVKGLCSADVDLWLKATKGEDNVYTFQLGQYMGLISEEYQGRTYYNYLFLMGYANGAPAELQMSYDEETGVFTTLNYMVENADYVDKMYYNSLVMPGAQLVPAEDPDAIATIVGDAEEGSARYNIAGQRVGKNYKGIVVENGKKVLVK